ETVRVAFAEREAYYGDPNVVDVPAEMLLSKAHAAERRALIRDRAWREMPPAGDRRPTAAIAGGADESLDTSYVAVVDADGNGFSATPSDPNVDSPAVAGVGCVVSGRGSQGWLDPGHNSVGTPGKGRRVAPAAGRR